MNNPQMPGKFEPPVPPTAQPLPGQSIQPDQAGYPYQSAQYGAVDQSNQFVQQAGPQQTEPQQPVPQPPQIQQPVPPPVAFGQAGQPQQNPPYGYAGSTPGDPGLGNKKPKKTKVIVTSVIAVTVLVLVAASLGIWAFTKSGKPGTASAKPAAKKTAPAPKAQQVSQIKFNTDLEATNMDLKLTGKNVKWNNPCPGLYYLDPARPYILCADKTLHKIEPDGSSKQIKGTYDSQKIRYGFVILHDEKGYDNRIYDIDKNIVTMPPPVPNNHIYFFTSEYFVQVYTDTDYRLRVQLIDRLGTPVNTIGITEGFEPSQVGNNDTKYENQGFFPVFPEKKNFVAFGNMVKSPLDEKDLKLSSDLVEWHITKDGLVVFSGKAEPGYTVTTYDQNMNKVDQCQYPSLQKQIWLTKGQEALNDNNLQTNQAFINECKFFQDLEKNPMKKNEYVTLRPDGKHQRWAYDSNTGDPSYQGVSYKKLKGQKIRAFFDHGNQIVLGNGAVFQLGQPEPAFTTETYPVPITYHSHKQFFIMDGRLWELAPAN